MNPIVSVYPLDLTGRNPNNSVVGEVHELVDNGRDGLRVFIPKHGSFFTQHMELRDAGGNLLTPGTDYIPTYLYVDATHRTGLEVCGAIIVKNPHIPATVQFSYQAVGGDYAQSTDALEQVLDALADDERPVEWAQIIGKPTEYPPGGHLHALWELYGFEYMVAELENIVQAIITGNQPMLDEVRAYALRLHDDIMVLLGETDTRFNDHLQADNPHGVTKLSVGLDRVQNFGIASAADTAAMQADNLYLVPAALTVFREQIATAIAQGDTAQSQRLDAHITTFTNFIARRDNPHEVTKAQVGLDKVQNYGVASASITALMQDSTSYLVPASLTTFRAAISSEIALLGATLESLVEGVLTEMRNFNIRTDNPHGVTKAQVGLGQVENYPPASNAQALAGTSSQHYLTPVNLKHVVDEHSQSGDHDHRYVRSNAAVNGSIRVENNTAYVYVNSAWRQFWPPVWQ